MKLRPLACLLLLLPMGAAPPPPPAELAVDDLLQMGRQFLEENLDEDFLELLEEADLPGGEAFFRQLQERFQSEYVVDLAELQKAARAWLPVLDAYEETAPYAVWLRARLDYLEAAEQLRRALPPPKVEPGKPPPPRPKPTALQQEKVWGQITAARPPPTSAAKLLPRLKPVFQAQGVPAELTWLAEVESSFNPNARSPAGAVGLYQLMPKTAKALGLSTWPRDERLDPEKSASAAARYLAYLHGRFKDWKLALAAYNAGEGRLQALLKNHRVKTFEAVAPYLPAETQMYVPKVEATLRKRENTSLAKLPAPAIGKPSP